jgi:GTP:adenosylcobinamide-phosphate guanylyltransferase
MLLITKISFSQLKDYKQKFTECLIQNSGNTHINKIIIFLEAADKSLPNVKNTQYIIKRDLSDDQLIEYAKKISKEPLIIFSNFDIIFSELELRNFKISGQNQIINTNYQIFHKDFSLKTKESKKVKPIENKIKLTNETVLRKNNSLNQKLDIIIVSVKYNDFLILTLKENSKIFSNITVISSPDDFLCHKICEKFEVKCLITDVMYQNGNSFNKGKAINEGIKSIQNPGFILILDADIIVSNPINLKSLDKDIMYSTGRWITTTYEEYKDFQSGLNINKIEYESNRGLGFFQLFYFDNQFYPENFDDAGWSDLVFRDKFKRGVEIENKIIHLGINSKNWKGRKTKRFIEDELFLKLLNEKQKYPEYFNYLEFLPNIRKSDIKFSKKIISKDKDPYILHITSTYKTENSETLRRVNFARTTWQKLYENKKIIPAVVHTNPKDELPKIKDFFEFGYKLCDKDDDIILYTNSDICITDDAYEKIIESCKKWQCTFSFRKDFFHELNFEPEKKEIEEALYSGGIPTPHGADLFAVTKKWWRKNKHLIPDGQVIARPTWDWIFRIAMEYSITEDKNVIKKVFHEQGGLCETPNISYHERHDSYWEKSENLLDEDSLNNVKIAFKWMSDLSNNEEFTGKDYFLKTYNNLFN